MNVRDNGLTPTFAIEPQRLDKPGIRNYYYLILLHFKMNERMKGEGNQYEVI